MTSGSPQLPLKLQRCLCLKVIFTWRTPLPMHASHTVKHGRPHRRGQTLLIGLQQQPCSSICRPACRLWHADVLEWVWFLNSHPEAIYGTMYGDKDTFPLSFYLARKGDLYNQIPVPPGAVLDATPEEVSQHSSLRLNQLRFSCSIRVWCSGSNVRALLCLLLLCGELLCSDFTTLDPP